MANASAIPLFNAHCFLLFIPSPSGSRPDLSGRLRISFL
jgi:hypothetical protein